MNTLALTILLMPFLFLLYHVVVYFRTRVPIIITPKKYYAELFKNFTFRKHAVIYELGCGKGDLLFAVEKFEPKKAVGFELSFVHVWYGKIKARLLRSKVQIIYKDFFKADISDADVIYLFLVKPILIKAWYKIKRETKQGTIVITLADTIPGEDFFQKIPTQPEKSNTTNYYLYKV